MCATWQAHVEMSEGDLPFGRPLEGVSVITVGKACPEIPLCSQTHQTDQESIFIPA